MEFIFSYQNELRESSESHDMDLRVTELWTYAYLWPSADHKLQSDCLWLWLWNRRKKGTWFQWRKLCSLALANKDRGSVSDKAWASVCFAWNKAPLLKPFVFMAPILPQVSCLALTTYWMQLQNPTMHLFCQLETNWTKRLYLLLYLKWKVSMVETPKRIGTHPKILRNIPQEPVRNVWISEQWMEKKKDRHREEESDGLPGRWMDGKMCWKDRCSALIQALAWWELRDGDVKTWWLFWKIQLSTPAVFVWQRGSLSTPLSCVLATVCAHRALRLRGAWLGNTSVTGTREQETSFPHLLKDVTQQQQTLLIPLCPPTSVSSTDQNISHLKNRYR